MRCTQPWHGLVPCRANAQGQMPFGQALLRCGTVVPRTRYVCPPFCCTARQSQTVVGMCAVCERSVLAVWVNCELPSRKLFLSLSAKSKREGVSEQGKHRFQTPPCLHSPVTIASLAHGSALTITLSFCYFAIFDSHRRVGSGRPRVHRLQGKGRSGARRAVSHESRGPAGHGQEALGPHFGSHRRQPQAHERSHQGSYYLFRMQDAVIERVENTGSLSRCGAFRV